MKWVNVVKLSFWYVDIQIKDLIVCYNFGTHPCLRKWLEPRLCLYESTTPHTKESSHMVIFYVEEKNLCVQFTDFIDCIQSSISNIEQVL